MNASRADYGGGGGAWRLVACLTLAFTLASGEEPDASQDKRSYTLFNPTPRSLMRELSADRPDKTESAHTVDAGHFQLEMDVANITSDKPDARAGRGRTTAYEVAPMNLKLGILNSVDMQLVLTPYRWERERGSGGGSAETTSGFSGVTPRIKLGLVGNDEGPFALALLPFVSLATTRDEFGEHRMEGGLKIPYAFRVPGWDLSAMAEIDAVRNEQDHGHHWVVVNSVSLGRRLFGRLSGYGEFFSAVSEERGEPWIGTADFWLTYQVNERLRLDAGIYVGVTPAADDWHPFLGLTWRY